MPVGLLDMADVCVYGQPNIINATFIGAAQQYLDAATSSSFHKHTVIRRCECGPDITVQGEAIAWSSNTWPNKSRSPRNETRKTKRGTARHKAI